MAGGLARAGKEERTVGKERRRKKKKGIKTKRETKKALTVLLLAGAPEYAGAADDWRGRERSSRCGAGAAAAGCRARNGDDDDVCDGGEKSEAVFVVAVVVDVGDINEDDDAESDVVEADWDENGDGGLDVANARPAPRMERLIRPCRRSRFESRRSFFVGDSGDVDGKDTDVETACRSVPLLS